MNPGASNWFRACDFDRTDFEDMLAAYNASQLAPSDGVKALSDDMKALSDNKETNPDSAEVIKKRIGELKEQSRTKSSSAVNCELELLTLLQCSDEDLAQRIPELRYQWATLTGRPVVSKEIDVKNRPALLAEARFLTAEIYRRRDLQVAFARTKWLVAFWSLLPIIAAFPVLALALPHLRRDPTVIVVLISGMCGGFISSCRRLFQLDPGPDILAACKMLQSDRARLIGKPILGAAFALALYLLFISHMITGALFPNVEIAGTGSVMGFQNFFGGTVTATSGDFAKLLVWSFIAGFAEQFVPDILDRFSSKASTGANGPKE